MSKNEKQEYTKMHHEIDSDQLVKLISVCADRVFNFLSSNQRRDRPSINDQQKSSGLLEFSREDCEQDIYARCSEQRAAYDVMTMAQRCIQNPLKRQKRRLDRHRLEQRDYYSYLVDLGRNDVTSDIRVIELIDGLDEDEQVFVKAAIELHYSERRKTNLYQSAEIMRATGFSRGKYLRVRSSLAHKFAAEFDIAV